MNWDMPAALAVFGIVILNAYVAAGLLFYGRKHIHYCLAAFLIVGTCIAALVFAAQHNG